MTGSLSLVGSSLLILMILRSKKKLSVPYRRLIFGTSVYDVFQSIGLTTSVFLSPEGTDSRGWAVGTTTTCDIQGLLTTLGAIGVPIYLCSLCIYYFCIIRLNMKKSTFKEIEPFLHVVPILYSMFCGIFALSNQYFNNAGSVCYVAPKPITCEIFPDQECDRGEGASRFRLLFLTYPSMVILVIVCIIMGVITCYAKNMEKRRSKYSFTNTQRSSVSQSSIYTEHYPDLSSPRNGTKSSASKIVNAICFWRAQSSPRNNGIDSPANGVNQTASAALSVSVHGSSIGPTSRRRSKQRSKDRLGEITKQALLYIGSYILSYGFVWAMSLHSLATKKPPLIWLRALSSIFFPLQGFINIFIYCRPHIVSLRALFPDEYTWFQAFVIVLKSGGDDPISAQNRRSPSVQRFYSTRNSNEMTSRAASDKDMMEMDSDSSSNFSFAAVTDTSEKKSNTTLPTLPGDIENQSSCSKNGLVVNSDVDDADLVDDIPESLENIVHSAEKMLDDTLGEFMDLADERKDSRKIDFNAYIEDEYSTVSDSEAFSADDQEAPASASVEIYVEITTTTEKKEDSQRPTTKEENEV